MPNDEKLYISQVSDATGNSPVLYAIKDAEAVHKSDEASYDDIYSLFVDPVPPYLTFTGTESFTLKTSNGKKWNGTIEYSTNKTSWTEWDGSSSTAISSGTGNVLYLRGKNNTHISATSSSYSYFVFTTTGTIACTGDIRTLLDYEDPENTTMDSYCYRYMFNGCTSLTVAPELPATTLADNCYCNMFYDCEALTVAPALPATTLAAFCYQGMFYNCEALTTIPELPATTLAYSCYFDMFRNCVHIKLSTTQTGAYQTEYRIPTSGSGTDGTDSLTDMFQNTGGTFTGTPTINTTYYTSNTIVS